MNYDYSVKDKVLKCICDHLVPEKNYQVDLKEMLKETDLDFDTLDAILTYFQRCGLIGDLNSRRVALSLIVHVEAFDLFNHGGFTATEELLKANLEKLLLEIESLKPSLPDRVSTITSIAANIATALGFILSK